MVIEINSHGTIYKIPLSVESMVKSNTEMIFLWLQC
jgi:hypothetical protein